MKILIQLLIICISVTSQAKLVEHIQTPSFLEIESKINKVMKQNSWHKEDVLLVFDIDNTLLKTNQDLGGDAWFTWQESLLKDENANELHKVAGNFGDLLKVQGQLFALSNMTPPEVDQVDLIKRLQKRGDNLLLTSRGYTYRNSTERELKRNGYSFNNLDSSIAGSKGFPGTYLPYDIENPELSGLTDKDLELVKERKARPVTYMDGLYMTAGQHKGVMLKLLLNKLEASQYKVIFFIDDHKRHTDRMAEAYVSQTESLYTFHYTAMESQVKAFNESDKLEVINQWKVLNQTMKKIFNN